MSILGIGVKAALNGILETLQEILKVNKSNALVNKSILEQTALTNLYLSEMSDSQFEKEDICQ